MQFKRQFQKNINKNKNGFKSKKKKHINQSLLRGAGKKKTICIFSSRDGDFIYVLLLGLSFYF